MAVPLPDELLIGPFHRRRALELGISARVLEGRRFVRVHAQVYRHRDHVMTFDDEVRGARLALPADAHPTGVTRVRSPRMRTRPASPGCSCRGWRSDRASRCASSWRATSI